MNGSAIRTARDMQRAILALPIGESVDVVVMRDGKLFLTKVAVEEHAEDVKPAAATAPATLNYNSLGLAVVELSVDAASAGTAEGGEGCRD